MAWAYWSGKKGVGSIPPPLDGFTSNLAASCSRRLYTAYSGSLIRVVRDADDVESDIIQDANGNLNELDLVDFWSAGVPGDLLVKNIYGQGGANTGLVQNTKASMGRIMDSSGNIYRNNSRPAIDFFGSSNKFYSFEAGGNFIGKFIYTVFQSPIEPVQQLFSHSSINTQFRTISQGGRSIQVAAASENLGNPSVLAEWFNIVGITQLISESAVDAQLFWNENPGTITTHANTSFNLNQIGRRSTASEIYGGITSEWVITESSFVDQRSAFVTNTKTYYGIS